MQYRKFGKLGFDVSILGFGCMRFPLMPGVDGSEPDTKRIDEAEAQRMVRFAIDNGVNYVDTAYPYHGGSSEIFVGKALKDGYREKVKLATKLPVWLLKTKEDFDKYLDEQLEKLQTDHIDFYLLHALGKERWNTVKELDVLGSLKKAIASGKVKHAGFSFHDDISFFRTILDSFDWGMCQIMFNYMEDKEWEKHISYAHTKGIAVVVMEPLLGGKLSNTPPVEVAKVWKESGYDRSPADWSFKWIFNHPEVTLALSGMSTMEQVVENLKIAGNSMPNALSEKELNAVNKVRELYTNLTKVKCTGCEYCLPCPNNVSIPQIFSYYNEAAAYNIQMESAKNYAGLKQSSKDASLCVECGKCEEACPQKLPIMRHLKEAHESLNG
ncbi:MAG TPA: aldo/keto reductase [Clostridia bacterium]|nr:aldo/keto reductase [Clostridia bacterium]